MIKQRRREAAQINKNWQDHGDFGEILQKETFYGIKKLLDLADGSKQPVIFIIKNIKAFNHQVLNDLIHLIKKYRATYGCNMSLMLGVQNNNRDEVYLRINMQNCTKLTIKTFYFPSMKNIILQVIQKILLSQETALVFGHSVIKQLIEAINIYGFSV
jgi:hypothetical protein